MTPQHVNPNTTVSLLLQGRNQAVIDRAIITLTLDISHSRTLPHPLSQDCTFILLMDSRGRFFISITGGIPLLLLPESVVHTLKAIAAGVALGWSAAVSPGAATQCR